MDVASTGLANDDAVLAVIDAHLQKAQISNARVLDLGGGTGVYAVPLALRGHDVHVIDRSPDALATLQRRAEAAGVSERVSSQVADVDKLTDAVADREVDLVLCHRVIEYVDDPAATLRSAAATVRPGGVISVVCANRPGAVLSRVLAGRFDEALEVLDGHDQEVSGRRFERAALEQMLSECGVQIVSAHGIGLVGELNPGQSATPKARQVQDRIEQLAAYRDIAPLVQVLAERPEA